MSAWSHLTPHEYQGSQGMTVGIRLLQLKRRMARRIGGDRRHDHRAEHKKPSPREPHKFRS